MDNITEKRKYRDFFFKFAADFSEGKE